MSTDASTVVNPHRWLALVVIADVGVASATLNTTQQIGGALGLALLNTVYVSAVSGYLASNPPALAVRRHANSAASSPATGSRSPSLVASSSWPR